MLRKVSDLRKALHNIFSIHLDALRSWGYIGNHINVNDRIMRDSYYYAFRNSRISELQISNIARSIGEFYTQTKECLFRNTVDHTVASECIRSGYNITNKIIKFDDYINAKKESELLKKAA